jgi:hypothetical protein
VESGRGRNSKRWLQLPVEEEISVRIQVWLKWAGGFCREETRHDFDTWKLGVACCGWSLYGEWQTAGSWMTRFLESNYIVLAAKDCSYCWDVDKEPKAHSKTTAVELATSSYLPIASGWLGFIGGVVSFVSGWLTSCCRGEGWNLANTGCSRVDRSMGWSRMPKFSFTQHSNVGSGFIPVNTIHKWM